MALKSMTGFGRARLNSEQHTITVELQSVNSKQFDLNLRLSSYFKPAETEIRSLLSAGIERGKLDCSVFFESIGNEKPSVFNKDLIRTYFHDLNSAMDGMNVQPDAIFSAVMRMPEISRQKSLEASEKEIALVLEVLNLAISDFTSFRESEGAVLEQDLIMRIQSIQKLQEQVLEFASERAQQIKARLIKALTELNLKEEVNQDRFEQEMIYYLEKLDITEEQLRLKTHCAYFLETIQEHSPGRKLGFISQEIGREINTIGSKANHSGIQRLVVMMKDELEKVKEQIANIL
jgi:uncharacterized protein (TIGR00255 family)